MDEAKRLRVRAVAALNLAKLEEVKDQRASLIVLASIWLETAEQLERQQRKGRKTVSDLFQLIESADTQS